MTRIRELRLSRGLRVIDLSFETRVHPSQLSCIERRKLAPSVRVREILCAFLCVPENEAFDGDGLTV